MITTSIAWRIPKTNFYPPELPDYLGVPLKDLKEDGIITILSGIFRHWQGQNMRVDGDSIEVFEDEILYKAEYKDH